VCSTDRSRAPSPSPCSIRGSGLAPLEPGSQSTNFSPIRPWEPILQRASSFHGTNAVLSMRMVTAAFLSGVTSIPVITPTGTPATFTSSPFTSVEALSKIARTT
jgi:hypothetical protein